MQAEYQSPESRTAAIEGSYSYAESVGRSQVRSKRAKSAPSEFFRHRMVKRCCDVFLVLVSMPVMLPVTVRKHFSSNSRQKSASDTLPERIVWNVSIGRNAALQRSRTAQCAVPTVHTSVNSANKIIISASLREKSREFLRSIAPWPIARALRDRSGIWQSKPRSADGSETDFSEQ